MEESMIENQLIISINNMLIQKELVIEKADLVISKINELIKLTNNTCSMAYVYLGKMNKLLGNMELAIDSYNTAININSDETYAYYELFEIYIENEQYELALQNIEKYSCFNIIDCDIYISLLRKIIFNEHIIISNKNDIFGIKDINNSLIKLYNKVINFINSKNYKEAFSYIRNCLILVENKKYEIDLHLLKILIEKICEMEKKAEIEALEKSFFSSSNIGLSYYNLINLHKKEPNNLNILLVLIEEAINICAYEDAKTYIDYSRKLIDDSNIHFKYLEDKLNEIISFPQYYCVEEIKSRINIEKMSNNDSFGAIKLCEEKFMKTLNPDYLYLLAKIMYNNGYYEQSFIQFNNYIKMGKKYLRETYIYIMYISTTLNNHAVANLYTKKASELFWYENINIDFDDFTSCLLSYKIDFSDKKCMEITKKLLNNNILYNSGNKKLVYG